METKKSEKFLSTLNAARKGDADALFILGVMYENGEETEQNYACLLYTSDAADE